MERVLRISKHLMKQGINNEIIGNDTSNDDNMIYFWRVNNDDTKHLESMDTCESMLSVDNKYLTDNINSIDITKIYSTEYIMNLFYDWIKIAGKYAPFPIRNPNKMCISTITTKKFENSTELYPNARYVLLKQMDIKNGAFIFYTNYNSAKSMDIIENKTIHSLFYWDLLFASVRITGKAIKMSSIESDKYWATRNKMKKLSQITSNQSEPIKSKEELQSNLNANKLKYKDVNSEDIKRPLHWGGWIINPISFEFWKGNKVRFHDRILFTKIQSNTNKWNVVRLQP